MKTDLTGAEYAEFLGPEWYEEDDEEDEDPQPEPSGGDGDIRCGSPIDYDDPHLYCSDCA